jgi:hypothetical protein
MCNIKSGTPLYRPMGPSTETGDWGTGHTYPLTFLYLVLVGYVKWMPPNTIGKKCIRSINGIGPLFRGSAIPGVRSRLHPTVTLGFRYFG